MPCRAYPDALAVILMREGGYVDDPDDPGGETNHGITRAVYDGWRAERGLHVRSVKLIEPEEVATIYANQYWKPVRGDDLLRVSFGVALVVCDMAVNAGVRRAVKLLQRVVAVPEDGVFGKITLRAVELMPPTAFVVEYSAARESFYEDLAASRPKLTKFLNGWLKRVRIVKAEALRDDPGVIAA